MARRRGASWPRESHVVATMASWFIGPGGGTRTSSGARRPPPGRKPASRSSCAWPTRAGRRGACDLPQRVARCSKRVWERSRAIGAQSPRYLVLSPLGQYGRAMSHVEGTGRRFRSVFDPRPSKRSPDISLKRSSSAESADYLSRQALRAHRFPTSLAGGIGKKNWRTREVANSRKKDAVWPTSDGETAPG